MTCLNNDRKKGACVNCGSLSIIYLKHKDNSGCVCAKCGLKAASTVDVNSTGGNTPIKVASRMSTVSAKLKISDYEDYKWLAIDYN
jgi:ribosomal protein S27AE